MWHGRCPCCCFLVGAFYSPCCHLERRCLGKWLWNQYTWQRITGDGKNTHNLWQYAGSEYKYSYILQFFGIHLDSLGFLWSSMILLNSWGFLEMIGWSAARLANPPKSSSSSESNRIHFANYREQELRGGRGRKGELLMLRTNIGTVRHFHQISRKNFSNRNNTQLQEISDRVR